MAMAEIFDMNDKRTAEKQKALESALAQIERQFGKGSIMKLGGDNKLADIEATSTGSLGLDIALGIGGLPKGRIIEVYGPESSGKTTLTLHAIAEEQKKGGVCAFVDAEHALDPQYAKKLGVNLDELLISQPDTGEQALEIVDTLVRSGAVSLVVVDSVAALTPKSELEGDMGDSSVGVHARLMSQAMRKLTGSISRSGCMVIFINQIRMKIEGVGPNLPPGTVPSLVYQAAAQLAVSLPESLAPRVKHVTVSGPESLGFTLKSGTEVTLGAPTDIRNKLISVLTVLNQQNVDFITGIDVSAGQPVVKND